MLLARRLPGVRVLCGPRRAELAALATGALGADALLLDDGFQHRALGRDLDVVVLDASNPFGNGHLLPVGPNREPRRALRRAGLIWLSRVDQATPEQLERLRVLAFRCSGRGPVESRHAPVDLLDDTLDPLARPGRGAREARAAPLRAGPAGRLPAHRGGAGGRGGGRAAPPRSPPLLRRRPRPGRAAADASRAELLVTTEKDAVRLPAEWAAEPRLAVVRIEAEVLSGAGVLQTVLDAALAGGDRRGRRNPP